MENENLSVRVICVCPSCGELHNVPAEGFTAELCVRTALTDFPLVNCGKHSELDMAEAFKGNRALRVNVS